MIAKIFKAFINAIIFIGKLLVIIFLAYFFIKGLTCNEDEKINYSFCQKYSLEDARQAYEAGNYSKALNIYSTICHYNNSKGKSCFIAGYFYSEGIGAKKDLVKSLYFFKKSCEKAYPHGCLALGWIYAVGITIRDEEYAKYLFKKLCDEGYELGCKELSNLKNYLLKENAKEIGSALLDLVPIEKGIKIFKSGGKIIKTLIK
jgi:TPR repeat protein